MTTTLPQLIAAARPIDGGFALAEDVPHGWRQGRTAYGGFSTALAVEAARRAGEDGLPPLRSAQVAFIGPLTGRAEARARVLRRGRNAVWIAAEVWGEAGLATTATFVFMEAVTSELRLVDEGPPEGWIAPEQAEPLPAGKGPPFIGNFEARYALPRTGGGARGELTWWLRLKDAAGLPPAVELLGVADVLPPAVLILAPSTAAVSSMTWQVNLLTPEPTTRDGWWLLRSVGTHAADGCSSQVMRVWNADGAPVAYGTQAIALFG